MNLPLFLARGVAKGGSQSISRTIIGIAVVAVAISMATMVLASALISGFKTEISVKIFGFWGHVHITEENAANDIMLTTEYPISTEQDFYPSLEELGPITYRDFEDPFGTNSTEERTTQGGIRNIQPFILLPGIVSVFQEGEQLADTEPLILKGIDQDFAWEDFAQYMVEGDALEVVKDSTSRGILISNSTSRRLQIGVGDRIDFVYFSGLREEKSRAFRVQGIYKTGLEEYDSKFAIVDIKQLRRLLNWRDDEVGGFEVILDDIDDLNAFANYIHYDVLPQHLYADSIRNKLRELFNWLDIQDYNGIIILILVVLVAVINMMTALLILILERTNMIGTLKALGQDNWSIRKIFLYYAGFIVIVGLLLGNFVGLGLAWAQKTFGIVKLDEESYYLAVAPIKLEWLTILGLNLGTFVITLAFLVLPSYLVTQIDPVKAIRFK
ncbi:Lipoprotein-releasing system transmembrane protein LolE [Neolewinella maritima]|uniref:Lipoprotein-releasing system transmembrane protein LolE n=1 Tax=Neolewinella maritima TaxID=1383882 RepID=A0ABM9AX43_9BACT|nr:FtsX-like permease family protein [Neolewinella maritima]CAH0999305.1 Lipoprotein-releasing system transmembrane protein LolE [Neolewinella maritima]